MMLWPTVRASDGKRCCCPGEDDQVIWSSCACAVSPTTLYFYNAFGTIGATDGTVPRTLTLTFQPLPASPPYTTFTTSLSGSAWLSDETWSALVSGTPTSGRWMIWCDNVSGVAYIFGKVTEVAVAPTAPNIQSAYNWTPGLGNNCEPFYMTQYGNQGGSGGGAGRALSAIAGDWGNGQLYLKATAYDQVFFHANTMAGVTVTLDGSTVGTTDADGELWVFVPQSASSRPWSMSRTGWTTVSGTLAGQAPQADRAHAASIVGVLPI